MSLTSECVTSLVYRYSQVTSQLGDVFNFTYPGVFGDMLETLKPIIDVW